MDVLRRLPCIFRLSVCAAILVLLAGLDVAVYAQQQQAPPAAPAPEGSPQTAAPPQQGKAEAEPEMNTHESAVPFSVRVNLVPVRVVVRDAQGRAVNGLHKEDFQLFEDRKPQVISTFTVETATSNIKVPERGPSPDPDTTSADREKAPGFAEPKRFVALLFDDVHSAIGDLQQTKAAAGRYVAGLKEPSDRVAVFTISGQAQLDFTDDRVRIGQTISQLQQRPVTAGSSSGEGECPSINYYEADLIQNHQDTQATQVATQNALTCEFGGDPRQINAAAALALSTAARILSAGDAETQYAVRRLKELIRRMQILPGQRTIVLVSPGFLTPNHEYEIAEVIDRASRSSVFINTLDDRGLYTPTSMPDISQQFFGDPRMGGFDATYRLEGQSRQLDVLISLANGTGGFSFHSNNDLDAGFRVVASAPEVSYLLGFTPQNLKYDGKFHSLKVTVESKGKYIVQARQGFFAPKTGPNPEDMAKKEMAEAIFSQEEQHGLPVALHLQYYKADATNAKLAVLTHVDIGRMQFAKVEGRNKNELTIVAVLFDRNGNYINAIQKTVDMRLRDSTLRRLHTSGITVKTNFDVKPGSYMVRLVVRDADASHLSTENGVVEIPY